MKLFFVLIFRLSLNNGLFSYTGLVFDKNILNQSKKVLFDVTVTARSPYKTGIQRVVEEIGLALSKLGSVDLGKSVDAEGLDYANLTGEEFKDIRENLIATFNSTSLMAEFKGWVLSINLLVKSLTFLGVLNLYRSIKNSKSRNFIKVERNQVSLDEYDTYFTADAFWNSDEDLMRILRAKQEGLEVVILVHDVLPLTHPEFFRHDSIRLFQKNFIVGASAATKLLFVSDYSLLEFTRLHPNNGASKYVVKLGDFLSDEKGSISRQIKALQNRKFALMVGTIEPRKNYDLVLEVFRDLDHEVILVIVGRQGWLSDNLIKKIKRMQPRVVWLKEVSDTELVTLIDSAVFGICASFAEGFGLPLREFVSKGLPTIASDIPPFKEVKVSSDIKYFNPYSIASLREAIVTLDSTKSITLPESNSWEFSAAIILEILLVQL